MVSTKHCCWGKCTSDSRYPDRLPKSLQEMQKIGKKIFIPFPKPSQGVERCQRWINACSRRYFTVKNITRNTYVCALHWPGEQGPTEEFPDPLKANLTAKEWMNEQADQRERLQDKGSNQFGSTPNTISQTITKLTKLIFLIMPRTLIWK